MSDLTLMSSRRTVPVLIGFIDFTNFQRTALRRPDEEIADFLDQFYRRVDAVIHEAGGHVVKFMGDAALIAFPKPQVDAGVTALLDLKRDIDEWLPQQGWPHSRLVVKTHFGEVVAGPFGPSDRLDIIGNAVNTTVTLESRGFALSAQAFRQLSKEARKRFKKHTPPITYIRVEDRHG